MALATGLILSVAAIAPAQRFGFGYGRGWYGHHRSYSSFGFGLGFPAYSGPTVVYQNAFTGDVTYAERTVNDFRRDYEKRKGDPLDVKSYVQRLDETMERLRSEAERFGGVTLRGSDLMRDVLRYEDHIDRRFRDGDDRMARDWDEVRRLLDRLARTYRVD